MNFKILICFLILINFSITLINGSKPSMVVKHSSVGTTFKPRINGRPVFVPLCYREGIDCCETFQENCLSNSQCKQNEVCCLSNCSVHCYDINLLGIIPENVWTEVNNTEDLSYIDSDPDFIRFPTNSLDMRPKNRTDCYPRSKTCCFSYIKKCHDNTDCGNGEVCCNEDCGTACYTNDKLGKQLFAEDGLTEEELEVNYEEEDDDSDGDNGNPVMITAQEKDDGTLTIVVKNYKP